MIHACPPVRITIHRKHRAKGHFVKVLCAFLACPISRLGPLTVEEEEETVGQAAIDVAIE